MSKPSALPFGHSAVDVALEGVEPSYPGLSGGSVSPEQPCERGLTMTDIPDGMGNRAHRSRFGMDA